MKKYYIIAAISLSIIAISAGIIIFKPDTMSSRLDDLEKIISKYEPEFGSVPYGTGEYTEMIKRYNAEIFAWAEIFEKERYETDSSGKILTDGSGSPVFSPKFKKVETRFYDLNNRMTKMVLKNIPKPENPQSSGFIKLEDVKK